MAPHSPAPSQTLPPHRSQPGFPMAESQMFCLVKPFIPGTEIQTQPELVPPRRVPNKRTPRFYPLSVPLYKSHSLFLQCPQLLPLCVHLPGWQHLSLSPLLCYSDSFCVSMSTHLAGSPFLIPRLGLHPELNLCSSVCISDPLPGPDLFLNTSLGYFVMLQSSCGAGEVLVVPQAWHGNQVLPVLVWGLGTFW